MSNECTPLPPEKYGEILELYNYCKFIGINAELEEMFDGYAIRFPCGGDFIQHEYSYGSGSGCVEPSIGSERDYSAVPLKSAKIMVAKRKEKLNRPESWNRRAGESK